MNKYDTPLVRAARYLENWHAFYADGSAKDEDLAIAELLRTIDACDDINVKVAALNLASKITAV